jgi:pimeloyl-ACP methyl ester carboxylesterase
MEIPLLVLHDADDREVPFEEGAALAARWRGAVLRESHGLGHNRILRDPEIGVALTEFLLGRPTGGRPTRVAS